MITVAGLRSLCEFSEVSRQTLRERGTIWSMAMILVFQGDKQLTYHGSPAHAHRSSPGAGDGELRTVKGCLAMVEDGA